MKKILLSIALLVSSLHLFAQMRVVILSDFPPVDVVPGGMGFGDINKRSDSDDMQSMVRFLLYTNEFDVEGLVATSATFANQANKQTSTTSSTCTMPINRGKRAGAVSLSNPIAPRTIGSMPPAEAQTYISGARQCKTTLPNEPIGCYHNNKIAEQICSAILLLW